MLDAAGLNGADEVARGHVQLLPSVQMGLEDGFDRERQFGVWEELIGQALTDGYGGLAATAEMTWGERWKVAGDDLIAYEATADELFAPKKLAALCQYDSRRFSAKMLRRAAHAHPCSIQLDHRHCATDYMRLHIDRPTGGRVFTIGGDIDLANVEFLERQLAELLSDGDATADCHDVNLIDVAGCRLLRQASMGDLAPGQLAITNAPAVLTRVLKLCDWADVAR
jgi:anti-anti-sigma regulatory factor